MKLIMPSEFENLRINNDHGYTINTTGDKEVLRLYMDDKLIAKRIFLKNKKKKAKRYFGSPDFKNYLTE